MKTSLTSVTFRKKTVPEIVDLTAQAGLDAIEWGGDIHVKPGDTASADLARRLCREKGLEVSAYGTYFRCEDGEDFAPVVENALRLETKVIRVWAGRIGSADCPREVRQQITENLKTAVAMAAEKGLIVATEYHPNTLTDHVDSALQLLADVPGLYTYWQPDAVPPEDLSYETKVLQLLGKKVVNIHAFYRSDRWTAAPLKDGEALWLRRFPDIAKYSDAEYTAIEFVMNGTEEQFLADAQALKHFVASC